MDVWRTTIANTIKNNLDPCHITGVHQTFQRGRVDESGGLTSPKETWLKTLEAPRPIAMTADLKITDLTEQG